MEDILKKLRALESDLYRAEEFDSKHDLLHQLRLIISLLKKNELKSTVEAKSLANRLEGMHKRIYDRGKPSSKLVDPKKTKIPGFSTYFKK